MKVPSTWQPNTLLRCSCLNIPAFVEGPKCPPPPRGWGGGCGWAQSLYAPFPCPCAAPPAPPFKRLWFGGHGANGAGNFFGCPAQGVNFLVSPHMSVVKVLRIQFMSPAVLGPTRAERTEKEGSNKSVATRHKVATQPLLYQGLQKRRGPRVATDPLPYCGFPQRREDKVGEKSMLINFFRICTFFFYQNDNQNVYCIGVVRTSCPCMFQPTSMLPTNPIASGSGLMGRGTICS